MNMTLEHAIDTQQWAHIPTLIQQFIHHTPTLSQGTITGHLPISEQARCTYIARMGDKLYRKKRFRDALTCFEYALSLNPNLTQKAALHGWLAEIYCRQPFHNLQTAQFHSEQAFSCRDQAFSKPLHSRKALSYSLYGNLPVYCETMVINAQLRTQIYPDWDILLYHDDSVPAHVLHRLQDLGVILLHIREENATHLAGTFWRFLALARPEYDVIAMRDADSLLSWREKHLVDDWLASGKPFHVMRDWYSHTDLILAGLWGARYGLLQPIRQWIDDYLRQTPRLHPTHADQNFLKTHIWHRIKHACVHHSSVFNATDSTWLENLPRQHGQGGAYQLGGWLVKTENLGISPATRMAQIHNERGKLVCEYPVPHDGKWEIPTLYHQLIHDKIWTLTIKML